MKKQLIVAIVATGMMLSMIGCGSTSSSKASKGKYE